MRSSGLGLFVVRMLCLTIQFLLVTGLFRFSTSWFSLGSLYVSKNLGVPRIKPNIMNSLHTPYDVGILSVFQRKSDYLMIFHLSLLRRD